MSDESYESYAIVTLGCPKNQVDSDKLAGTLAKSGMVAAVDVETADVVVVNTCTFIEEAREESVETILTVAQQRQAGARLVVTGCMAERYGDELAAELPEIDYLAPFGMALLPALTGASSRGSAGVQFEPEAAPVAARAPASAAVPVVLGPTRGSALRVPDFDPPQPAAARGTTTLGLREDRRRMRPGLWFLCHPIVSGSATQSHNRTDHV